MKSLRYDQPRSASEIRKANLALSQLVFRCVGEGPIGDEDVMVGARSHPALRAYLRTGGGPAQLQTLAQYRWAEGAFPLISLGHKYAAALLVTHASEEAVKAARPPFPSFLIEVPEGLIACREESGALSDVLAIFVVKTEYHSRGLDWAWAYVSCSAHGTTLYRFGVDACWLLESNVGPVDASFDDCFNGELTDIDERAMALIGRLVIYVCLAFSDPTNVQAPKDRPERHRINSAFKGRTEPTPTARVYVLSRPVRHDFRDRVRAYMQGKARSAPNVQVLVAGHHKMQPHGPNSSLRKLIWLEPYWRGAEDAPIAFRPHQFPKGA